MLQIKYAKHANWLANLISSTCDPFYGAASKKQTNLYVQNSALFERLGNNEEAANTYKAERNRAMTREALCYYNLGDYATAVPLLTKALDLLTIEETDLWTQCMDTLLQIVGLQ